MILNLLLIERVEVGVAAEAEAEAEATEPAAVASIVLTGAMDYANAWAFATLFTAFPVNLSLTNTFPRIIAMGETANLAKIC